MNQSLPLHISKVFLSTFDSKPVLVSAPGRVNIIGEHTDYNDGFVLPAAIDKSIVSAIGKSGKEVCTAYALDNDEIYKFSLRNIKPIKNGGWRNYVIGVVAEIKKKGLKIEPFNLVFGGDIPQGAGLSSSAALENSVVFALNHLFELRLTRLEMIHISQLAEHNYAGVKCGIMDQYASMFGVSECALFLDCRSLDYKAIKVDLENYRIVLIDSKVKHNLADDAYNERRQVCEKVSSLLNVKALRDADKNQLQNIRHLLSHSEYSKALYVIQENNRVRKAVKYLLSKNIKEFSELLFESHSGLQKQFDVSCRELDFLVEQARKDSNVIGARMMGGGFGGCTINIVRKNDIQTFFSKISNLYEQEFGINVSMYNVKLDEGVRLI